MSKTATQTNQNEPSHSTSPESPGLSSDEVFETLSNRRRRHVLYYLQRRGGEATLQELSDQVAAWETDQPVDEVSRDEQKRVYTSLQQFHLPRMDRKGIVDFDDSEGVVERDSAAETVDNYLDGDAEADSPWNIYYFCLAGIGIVLVSLSWLDISPLAAVPNAGWIAILLTALAVSSLAHAALTRRGQGVTEDEPPERRR